MKYYMHDSSAFDDEKITELFMAFGYEGLGLFYTVLEKLAKQEQPIKTVVLKKQLSVGKKLEKCWKFMEEIGLLSTNNGETFNKQLLNFSGKYAIKSEKNKKRVSEWREKQLLIENVTRNESVRNAPKDKISKDNISKETPNPLKGESAFSLSIPEGYEASVNEWLSYKRELKKPYKTERSTQAIIDKLVKLSNGKPEVAAYMIKTAIENNWQGFFEPKLEDIPSTEPIPLGYRLAAMRCGAKTDDQIRKIIPKFEGLNPDFVGLWFWHNKVVPDAENIRTLPNWMREMKVEKNEIRKVYAKHKAEGVRAILEKSIEWTKTKLQ